MSQCISMTNGEYAGVLTAPLTRVVVSDLEAFDTLLMYLYQYSQCEKAETFVADLDAITCALNERLRVIKGELWYNISFGLPLFDKVASKIQMDSAVLNIVNSQKGVEAVTEFNSTIVKSEYRCTMKIKTQYGDATISI